MAKKASTQKTATHKKAAPRAEEKKKLLMNWFLIIIMVGSVGIALVSSGNNQPEPDASEPPPLKEAPTILPFTAENVDATVEDVFGSMILLASTSQPDLAKIDAQLRGIPGVSRVNSQFKEFKEASQGPQQLAFMAEVLYAPEIAPTEMLSRIQEQATLLNEVVVYPLGLVSLPETIHFVNDDLNLSKDFQPKDRFAQAFLSVETRKGDAIQVNLQADLAGENVQQMTVYESQNPSNAPQIIELIARYPLDSQASTLAVLGDLPYSSNPLDANALKGEALALKGLVSAQLEFENPPLALQVVSQDDFSAKAVDLNQSLSQLTGILRARLDVEGKSVYLDFQSTVDYADLKKELVNVFAAVGVKKEALTFVDPRIRLAGIFDASTNELAGTAQQLQALFQSRGIAVEIYQLVAVKADQFVDHKTGNEYAIEGGFFQALAKPGHPSKDEVSLGIQFLGKRGQALNIQAIEGEAGSPVNPREQSIPFKVN